MTTTPSTPPVIRTAIVSCDQDRAFAAFVDEIGAWWPLPTHSVFGADSGGVRIDDGLVVEWATDGRRTVWAEITRWDPPTSLAMAWHPGGEEADASRVEICFVATDDGTRVEIRHDGWEAFGEAGPLRRHGYVGPSAWGHVLDHFADGAEDAPDAPDVEALRAAYDTFLRAAAAGGDHAPPPGEWGVDQVIAHIALNDLAMTAVAHALVHGGNPTFDNRACQVPAHLDAVIAACGDRAGLVRFARSTADQAVAAAARLDPDQLDRAVHSRMESDGQLVFDQEAPWRMFAIEIQAARHLPAHTEQIETLST